MPEIPPIDEAELEAFRLTLPEIDRIEKRNDGIPWDIVKARYLAYRANLQPVEVDPDTCWKKIKWISDIKPEYALSEQVDLNKPIIIVKRKNDAGVVEDRIIDGSHRVFKAHHNHIATIPAYILSEEEGELCILPNYPLGL